MPVATETLRLDTTPCIGRLTRASQRLSLTALAITAAATWWFVFRPATKRINLTAIARYVEEKHPELQETISSAVELISSVACAV